jgi:hypothetical protein
MFQPPGVRLIRWACASVALASRENGISFVFMCFIFLLLRDLRDKDLENLSCCLAKFPRHFGRST